MGGFFPNWAVVISRRFVLPILIGLTLVPAGQSAERVVRQNFAVEPGCELTLATYRGAIVVEEGDAPEVRIVVTVRSDLKDEAAANRAIDALQLDMKAENNRVSINAQNPRFTGVRFVWNEKEELALAYHITVPRKCSVNAATANGGILIGSLSGQMVARADLGTVTLRRIDGTIRATSGSGDLVVSRCSGDLTLTTGWWAVARN